MQLALFSPVVSDHYSQLLEIRAVAPRQGRCRRIICENSADGPHLKARACQGQAGSEQLVLYTIPLSP